MCDEDALRHDVLVHESDDEYVARSAVFLKEGLAAGEGGIVANSRAGIAMMRDALGPDSERVAFVDNSQVYTRPARAVAAYCGAIRDGLRTAPSVRAVASMQMGPALDSWDEWAAYEAITSLAYSHLPAWVLCAYDANGLPDPVLDDVLRTHAEVAGDAWEASDRFEDPRALVRRLTPEPEPLPGLRSFAPGDDLERFRELLAREMAAEDVPAVGAVDMLVAGTEIAANAKRHGGIAEVRAGRAEGRFVFEVVDRGPGFDDPMAGYLVPRDRTGAGLWVARQLAWLVEPFHSPRGFTVRVWL